MCCTSCDCRHCCYQHCCGTKHTIVRNLSFCRHYTARGRTSRFFFADIVGVMELLQNATLVDKGGRRRPAKEALRVWWSFSVNLLFIRLNETGLQSCCILLFCALVSSLSPVYSSSRKVYQGTHSDRMSRILTMIPTQSP